MLFVSYEFYIKNIYLFIFAFFFLILVKFDKQVDTTDPFNKWVMLGLINLDLFNKYIELVLTHIIEYSWINMNSICKHKLSLLSYRKTWSN